MNRVGLWLFAGALATPLSARAQLFSVPKLDPSFCEQTTYRQTVVYIDDTMMVDGRTDWAERLAGKLRATLAPGERVTVVRLSPADGQSHELWAGCWPAYDEAARARLQRQTFIFQRNPLEGLADQQKLFLQGLNDALGQIYVATKRPPAAVQFSPAAAPNKQIIRALANDEGRFAGSKSTIRAILYSDLAENSDLGSVFQPAAQADYGHKLGSYLHRSVFYDFGLGADVTDDPSFPETARGFWTAALRSMAASVGGIDSDLNVTNIIPRHGLMLPLTIDFNGEKLDGKISLLSDDDGDLVDSWVGISRLSIAAITGSLVCDAQGGTCRLNAQTRGGVATTSPSEQLTLEGIVQSGLHGRLGVTGSSTIFAVTTSPPLP